MGQCGCPIVRCICDLHKVLFSIHTKLFMNANKTKKMFWCHWQYFPISVIFRVKLLNIFACNVPFKPLQMDTFTYVNMILVPKGLSHFLELDVFAAAPSCQERQQPSRQVDFQRHPNLNGFPVEEAARQCPRGRKLWVTARGYLFLGSCQAVLLDEFCQSVVKKSNTNL